MRTGRLLAVCPRLNQGNFYRAQTYFQKVMFLHVSVIVSVKRGRTWARHHPPTRYNPRTRHPSPRPARYTPRDQRSPQDTPPFGTRYIPHPGPHTPRKTYTFPSPTQNVVGHTVNTRPVRIILECNFFYICIILFRGGSRQII